MYTTNQSHLIPRWPKKANKISKVRLIVLLHFFAKVNPIGHTSWWLERELSKLGYYLTARRICRASEIDDQS